MIFFECTDPCDGELMGSLHTTGLDDHDSNMRSNGFQKVTQAWSEFMMSVAIDDMDDRNVDGFVQWFNAGDHGFQVERIIMEKI